MLRHRRDGVDNNNNDGDLDTTLNLIEDAAEIVRVRKAGGGGGDDEKGEASENQDDDVVRSPLLPLLTDRDDHDDDHDDDDDSDDDDDDGRNGIGRSRQKYAPAQIRLLFLLSSAWKRRIITVGAIVSIIGLTTVKRWKAIFTGNKTAGKNKSDTVSTFHTHTKHANQKIQEGKTGMSISNLVAFSIDNQKGRDVHVNGIHCADWLQMDYNRIMNNIHKNETFWCFKNDKSCRCSNPLEPKPRFGHRSNTWYQAHHQNAHDAIDAERHFALSGDNDREALDVVFLGDSITENWKGTALRVKRKFGGDDNLAVFRSFFTRNKEEEGGGGGGVEGLPLGIWGDRCPNLLWRIRNGEMPDSLRPKVWWVLIGTNDLGADHCTPDSILWGIIRIVQEIRTRRRDAIIVVNGILPRGQDPLSLINDEGNHWKEISWINDRLRCYCDVKNNTIFFNATDIFLREEDNGTSRIDESLMHDFLHPSAFGYRKWAERIVEKLKELEVSSSVGS